MLQNVYMENRKNVTICNERRVKMYREAFPSRLREARESAGYTQQQVEDETGIKRASLSHYEKGKREPDIETLGILAEFYCVSTDWLFGIGQKRKD